MLREEKKMGKPEQTGVLLGKICRISRGDSADGNEKDKIKFKMKKNPEFVRRSPATSNFRKGKGE